MAQEDFVTHDMCELRCKKLEDEDNRQNERIRVLEDTVLPLALSVEKLSANVERTLQQLTVQNSRLESLEGRAGENWRKVVGAAITVVVGAVLGFIFAHVGIT